MKILAGTFVALAVCACAGIPRLLNPGAAPLSSTQRNGFIAEEPLKFIKQAFLVADHEKPIVGTIRDASTSIASFANEVMATHADPSRSALVHVLPAAKETLRLPPEASNGTDRYVFSRFYCWKLADPSQLQLQIEWADVTTPQRYTDSYVFVKSGTRWYFSHHGDLAPFRYRLVGYDFNLPCSP